MDKILKAFEAFYDSVEFEEFNSAEGPFDKVILNLILTIECLIKFRKGKKGPFIQQAIIHYKSAFVSWTDAMTSIIEKARQYSRVI